MYDNSRQRSAVLPIILGTVGSVLAGMVVRRIREDRAGADGPPSPRSRAAAGSRTARRNVPERGR